MDSFEFSIIATGLDPEEASFESRFFNQGCDDATISFQRGLIIIDFTRESQTIDEALSSAVAAVRAAGANIIRVEPDPLVTLSDIAERSGMTRAAISLYASGQRGRNFPTPVARITSDSPLWAWVEVSEWLVAAGRLPQSASEAANAIGHVNERLNKSLIFPRFAA